MLQAFLSRRSEYSGQTAHADRQGQCREQFRGHLASKAPEPASFLARTLASVLSKVEAARHAKLRWRLAALP